MKIDKIYCMDNVDGMKKIDTESIDLVITSPPYDDLRIYNGYTWSFDDVSNQLFRVVKTGGVVVWNVNDKTIKGSETGTSFKQALHFMELGFNLETMIWEKTGSGCLGSSKFYGQNFEYMFVLTKGLPKTHNLICDRENKVKTGVVKVNGGLGKNGKGKVRIIQRKPFGKRTNIWKFDTQKNSSHPAPFPESLVRDHIISWSNKGDIVLDPFMGSGTTAKVAKDLGRHFIGFDVSQEYVDMANRRLQL